MSDGRLLAGAYTEKDEHHAWGPQQKAYVDKMIRDPELAYLSGMYYLQGRSGQVGEGSRRFVLYLRRRDGMYYLQGRSGQVGEGSRRFVLYQSDDGIQWGNGIIVSGDTRHPDGYSQNCIINKNDDDVPDELMTVYSIVYKGRYTNEYVYFIRPDGK